MKLSKAVLDNFIDGEMSAFQDVYEVSKSFVYNTIYKMVLSEQDAQDLMHDVYVRVYEKRHQYKKDYSIYTWINRIAINHVLNFIKRKNSFVNKLAEVGFFYEQKSNDEQNDEGEALQLLQKLKPKYRLPIVLKDIQDLSYEEVASLLNIPIGTVRSRLSRGRKQLKERYEREVLNGKQ